MGRRREDGHRATTAGSNTGRSLAAALPAPRRPPPNGRSHARFDPPSQEGHECSALAGGETALFEQYQPRFAKIETSNLKGASTHTSCVDKLAAKYGYATRKEHEDTILRLRDDAQYAPRANVSRHA